MDFRLWVSSYSRGGVDTAFGRNQKRIFIQPQRRQVRKEYTERGALVFGKTADLGKLGPKYLFAGPCGLHVRSSEDRGVRSGRLPSEVGGAFGIGTHGIAPTELEAGGTAGSGERGINIL